MPKGLVTSATGSRRRVVGDVTTTPHKTRTLSENVGKEEQKDKRKREMDSDEEDEAQVDDQDDDDADRLLSRK